VRSSAPLAAGDHTVEVVTTCVEPRPGGPLEVVLRIDAVHVEHLVPASEATDR
jgi:arylsulfatase